MLNKRALIKRLLRHPVRMSRSLSRFFRDMKAYNHMNTRPEFHARFSDACPCLDDWYDNAGSLSYYFWQDLWAARKIFQAQPSEHYDIGSRLDGFIAHILLFMPVTMIDIRPLPQKVEGLNFIQADATNLESIADNSLVSLSSLCAPEHFGLGRYGDPVDPEACFKAMKSMQRVLAKGGHLYIAVPVADESGVAFNAHRIFRPELIVETMNELKLADFSVIDGFEYTEHITFEEFHTRGFSFECSRIIDGLFDFVKE